MNRNRTPQEAAAARRLQDLGTPLEFDEDQCKFVFIRQCGSQDENSALELRCGAMNYIISLSITSGLPNLGISYIDLTLPWSDPNFYWLDDPGETGGSAANYKLPGTNLWYSFNEVLNHRINLSRTLRRGSTIQGLLLGFGGRMPREFKHGMDVPARLTVVDQFDNEYPQEVELRIDRSEGLLRKTSPMPKREPIFGDHDEFESDYTTASAKSERRPMCDEVENVNLEPDCVLEEHFAKK